MMSRLEESYKLYGENKQIDYLLWVNRKVSFEESKEKIIKRVKELKEEAENGWNLCNSCSKKTRCEDCKKALEILNAILGNQENHSQKSTGDIKKVDISTYPAEGVTGCSDLSASDTYLEFDEKVEKE